MLHRNPLTSWAFNVCLALLLLPVGAAAQTKPVEFYIAPNGVDSAPGTPDAPLATVAHARDLIRQLKQRGPLQAPVRVVLRGGVYPIRQTLRFNAEDAGSESRPIIYTAQHDENVSLNGGGANGPRLKHLLSIEGTEKARAGGLRFEHLTFHHDDALESAPATQPAAKAPSAVLLKGAQGCVFYGCTFTGLAGYAAEVGAASADNRFIACHFKELGAGAVKIDSNSQHTTVADCRIAHSGGDWLGTPAIWVLDSPRNRIVHNEITDFEGGGISCGATPGYGHAQAFDNQIEANTIYSIACGDMGAIRTQGIQAGTVIRGNVIHDITGPGGLGIFADAGSSYLMIESNLVYRTQSAGFQLRYGRDNLVRNNIFALSSELELRRTLPERIRSFVFEQNIVYQAPGSILLAGEWLDGNYAMRENIYWREGGTPDFSGHSLAHWQRLGLDVKSIVADPLFANPDAGDFSLKPASPALRRGFRPLEFAQAGPHPLDPRKVALGDWPAVEEPPHPIIEGRLLDTEHNGVSGAERFMRGLEFRKNKPLEVTYHLWNCGTVPTAGVVVLRILPPEAPVKIEGSAFCRYNLKPDEKALFRINLRSQREDVNCRLMAIPRGEGLVPSALYITPRKK